MVLEAINIGKTYNKRKVVKDVSLKVEPTQVVGLLGSNGAGKTTTFYIMTGLISPSSGLIQLEQKNITKLPIHKRVKLGIGYIPQETSVFEKLTVENNLIGVLQFYKKSKKEIQKITTSLLEDLNIIHLRKELAFSLSGGEKKRLEIARALTTNPQFILMDEPFAGVDPIAIDSIHILIKDLTKKNIGVLITDHNAQEILQIVDKVYLMNEGEILISGTAEQIVNNKLAQKYYFGEDFSFNKSTIKK